MNELGSRIASALSGVGIWGNGSRIRGMVKAGNGSYRVGAGVELGGVGALVAARRWGECFGHGYRTRAATRAPTPHPPHSRPYAALDCLPNTYP
ncbi:MAG TPA: hypothetical protein VK140_14930 [Ktedonobacteraceae bacterium]|nr:hypothetical protein [Ktedonobacteraceae bacterium]